MVSVISRIIENQIRTWEAAAEKRRAEDRIDPNRAPEIRPCITIARMIGSGGDEIAKDLEKRLGWQALDHEIVDVIVRQGHFREAIMNALDEHDRSSAELWVDGLLHGRIVDKGDYHHVLVRVLASISAHGHAIVLGRGANFVMDPRRTLSVLTAAPRSVRVDTVSRLHGISPAKAATLVKQSDGERTAFVAQHFHSAIDDPTAYDLTINTARLGPREASIEMITQALRLKFGGAANGNPGGRLLDARSSS